MATKKVIAAGDISEEAEKFLREHGAQFNDHFSVSLIELPENALVQKDGYEWRYAIGFDEEEEDENGEQFYCEVELYVNALDTRITLKKN